VVAYEEVPAGERLQSTQLSRRRFPSDLLPADAVPLQRAGELVGRRLLMPVARGAPLRWSDLVPPTGAPECEPATFPKTSARPVPLELPSSDTQETLRVVAPIAPGARIQAGALERVLVQRSFMTETMVPATDAARVVGARALRAIAPGVPLRWTDLRASLPDDACETWRAWSTSAGK
jgi:Flp pilus assembly protein CpaB